MISALNFLGWCIFWTVVGVTFIILGIPFIVGCTIGWLWLRICDAAERFENRGLSEAEIAKQEWEMR